MIKKIGLVGLGVSNLGILRMLKDEKDTVLTVRSQKEITLPEELSDREVRVLTGERYLDNIDEEILYLSPSVRRDTPSLLDARACGILFSSDAEEFFKRVRGGVYAITGSDGKSTTTAMTGAILQASGDFPSVSVAGNIGRALVDTLPYDSERAAFVTELSSFQLSYMRPRTKRAVITNLSPNHLNWHRDYEEYAEAKRNLLIGADEPILGLDCEAVRPLYEGVRPYAVFSTRCSEVDLRSHSAEVTVCFQGDAVLRSGVKILAREALAHLTEYNQRNFLAALCLSDGHYDEGTLREVLSTFRTMPHRAEYIGTLRGVRYVNSSVDSTPSRTAMTLSAFDGEVILLLGGRGKGVPYQVLCEPIRRVCRAVILYGENREKIREELTENGTLGAYLHEAASLTDAVDIAARIARSGATVLLSPASTSFDAFSDFTERGECFRQAYLHLKNKNQRT